MQAYIRCNFIDYFLWKTEMGRVLKYLELIQDLTSIIRTCSSTTSILQRLLAKAVSTRSLSNGGKEFESSAARLLCSCFEYTFGYMYRNHFDIINIARNSAKLSDQDAFASDARLFDRDPSQAK
ncbi:hypothetical protein Fot_13634 [Forsythia ovata]|uniref:Uncharacterized protein n=1 Tax=Forsythia ovata TaxID=205694 RepID=A0ABD1W4G5_9LAMI